MQGGRVSHLLAWKLLIRLDNIPGSRHSYATEAMFHELRKSIGVLLCLSLGRTPGSFCEM